MIGEDYDLGIHHGMPEKGVAEKLPEFKRTIKYHYTYWNARLGEQLATLWLIFPKYYFNIFNSLITIYLIILIFFYGTGRLPEKGNILDTFILYIVFNLFLLGIPAAGELFFWVTGASNYLWGLVILLSFFIPYRLLILGADPFLNVPKPAFVLFALFGFLAGSTNENTVPLFVLMTCPEILISSSVNLLTLLVHIFIPNF